MVLMMIAMAKSMRVATPNASQPQRYATAGMMIAMALSMKDWEI
jgi:hypothetical protein